MKTIKKNKRDYYNFNNGEVTHHTDYYGKKDERVRIKLKDCILNGEIFQGALEFRTKIYSDGTSSKTTVEIENFKTGLKVMPFRELIDFESNEKLELNNFPIVKTV